MHTSLFRLALGLFIGATSAQAADLVRPGAHPGDRALDLTAERPAIARSNVYLRADMGVGRQSFSGLSQADLAANGGTFISHSLDDATIFGAGIGWELTHRLRVDLTGEYRSSAGLKAMDNLTATLAGPDGTLQANTTYDSTLKSYVGLINVYYDLFKWRGMTPYIGAGIGFAHHRVSGTTSLSSSTFTDAASGAVTTQLNTGIGGDASTNRLAWALMAGASFDLSSQAKLDVGYRYLDLGSGVAGSTGLLECTCGTVGQPLKMRDLDSHEFRIGIRWNLSPERVAYQPLK